MNRTGELNSRVSFWDEYRNELINIFETLPSDVQGLSIDSKRLAIFWNEGQGEINKRKRLSNEKI